MIADRKQDHDFEVLVSTLLDKTLKRKLRWQETALEDTFLAAVKGIQTYQVSLDSDDERQPVEPTVRLVVRDEFGGHFLEYSATGRETSLHRLFEAVKDVASPIRERIGKTLELLNSL